MVYFAIFKIIYVCKSFLFYLILVIKKRNTSLKCKFAEIVIFVFYDLYLWLKYDAYIALGNFKHIKPNILCNCVKICCNKI